MKKIHIKKGNSALTILISFVALILVGGLLLMLPIAVQKGKEPLNLLEAMFMSTTATTTTGLTTVETGSTLSVFGKVVTGLLMEIGGLSIIVILGFLIALSGNRISLNQRNLFKDSLNQDSTVSILNIARNICLYSLVVQVCGTIIYFIILRVDYADVFNAAEAFGMSLYHTISAYMNAGLDIVGKGNSFAMFHDNIFYNINTSLVQLLGGLSGIVFIDVITKRKWKNFQLNTKIVLSVGLFLTVFGTLLIYIGDPSLNIFESLYFCLTSRSSGFSINDTNKVSEASAFVISILMFIGDAPASTTAGIKTTTLLVVVASIISFLHNKEPHFFKRKISKSSISRAFYLLVFAISFCFASSIIIGIFDPDFGFFNIMFDVSAAFSTDGLCRGDLTSLTAVSQIVLILDMILGRIGMLTLLSIFKSKSSFNQDKYEYIEENVIIG